jgi:DNA-binding transcriptional ArsR family regulator
MVMPPDQCDLLCLDLPVAEDLRQTRLGLEARQAPADRAKALSDPTRLMLAHALREAPLCVCDLAWVAERSQNLVSHHVQILRRAGVVEGRREGKMVMYELTPSGRVLLEAVLEGVAS